MSEKRHDLRDLTPGEATRRIARAFLVEARQGANRLDDPDDAESLHDFRVAIRRMRATFRLWGDALAPEIGPQHAKGLRKVQRATGDGRDSEVMLEWVAKQAKHLDERERVGQAWWADALQARKEKAYAKARGDVRAAFSEIEDTLHAQLSKMTRTVDLDGGGGQPTYAAALAGAVRRQMQVVQDRLAGASSMDDAEQLHDARIDVKRIRYLVEPIRGELAEANDLIKAFKAIQDVLGEFNDHSVLAEELRRVGREQTERQAKRVQKAYAAGAEAELAKVIAADRGPGLARLAVLNRNRGEKLLDEVITKWLGGGLDTLSARVDAFADRLLHPDAAGVEIERKYLLTGLPKHAVKNGQKAELDQGYLPGEVLIERVRRIRTAHGERFVRTVKTGKGIARVEIEEACSAEVFAALWALTEGCRVTKVRYAVADGDRIWEIDAFTDRELFLAEVELPTEDAEVIIPPWLAKHLDREVTEDGSYTNRKLAR